MADNYGITDAGPSAPPDPWVTLDDGIGYDAAVLVPRNVAGGNMGHGSINVANLFINGIDYVTPVGAYLPLSGGALTGTLSVPGVANIIIPGGISGNVLTTDGSGNCTWTSPSSLPYLPLSGGTITGTLILGGPTTIKITGGATGQVLSTNGSGILSWIAIGGLADAPNDGTLYSRKSAAWVHPVHTDISDWTATLASYATTTSLSSYALTSSVPIASTTNPLMNGAVAVGTGTTWARSDHVHPIDTSRYAASNPSNFYTGAQVSSVVSAYLPLSGGTVTGALTCKTTLTGYNYIQCISSTPSNYSIFQAVDGSGRSVARMYSQQNTGVAVFDNPTLGGQITLNGNINLNSNVICSGNVSVPGNMTSNTLNSNSGSITQLQTTGNGSFGAVYPGYYTGNTSWFLTYSGGQNVQFEAGSAYYYAYNSSTGFRNWIVNSSIAMSLGASGVAGAFLIASSTAWKAGGGAWTAISDSRIKNVLSDYNDGLDKVLRLHPIIFTYKGNDTSTDELAPSLSDKKHDDNIAPYRSSAHYQAAKDQEKFVGFIAQELEEIFPTMVNKREAYIDGMKVNDLRDNNTSELIFALVNAVKTLHDRIATLEAS